jgi:hypothetical protein
VGVDSQPAPGASRGATAISRSATRGIDPLGEPDPDVSVDRRGGHDVLDESVRTDPGAASLRGAGAGPGPQAAVDHATRRQGGGGDG